jgi:hypothetical protein
VDTRHDELLGLTEKLTRENSDRGGAVTDLRVLGDRGVDDNLGRRVVHGDRLEDGSTVVGDHRALARHGLKDLIHTLGAKSSLDHVSDGNAAKVGGETGKLALLAMSALLFLEDLGNDTLDGDKIKSDGNKTLDIESLDFFIAIELIMA